ncbi:MAG: hypothetical protein Q9165_004284 [Trypethelium subeluteriae]
MAQLALRAFAYGVDKIPDSAWDRVPGGYFRDKEKKRQKEEDKRRQQRQSRRARSDSRGPKRSSSRDRRHRDDDYYSDGGENAHSYGKHREGYSAPRDSRALDRNSGPSPPPPTDPTPGIPQHEAGHYPEPPGHHHGPQHYQNRGSYNQNKNVNPSPAPNQHYFPPPPIQPVQEPKPQVQPQFHSPEHPQAAQGADYYARPGQTPNSGTPGHSSGSSNTQYATQYPSVQPSPNPYAQYSASPASFAARGTFSPTPPSSASSAGQRYRPPHVLNSATTAGPYDRVNMNSSPNQPAMPPPNSAPAREPYIPYNDAVYYNQPAQQAAAYRSASISSASGGYTSRDSPRGSMIGGVNGSRPGSLGAHNYTSLPPTTSPHRDDANMRDGRYAAHSLAVPAFPSWHGQRGRSASAGVRGGRDPQRRAHSAADSVRQPSASGAATAERSRSRLAGLSQRLGTDEKALGAGALGAVVGGVIGHEAGTGGFSTLAGLLIGGVGGHALERGRRRRKGERESARAMEDGEQQGNLHEKNAVGETKGGANSLAG